MCPFYDHQMQGAGHWSSSFVAENKTSEIINTAALLYVHLYATKSVVGHIFKKWFSCNCVMTIKVAATFFAKFD